MTQGADGGPGLSGLVVQTSTSLGLLFPSVFDAMSCRESRGRVRKGLRAKEKVRSCQEKGQTWGNPIELDQKFGIRPE